MSGLQQALDYIDAGSVEEILQHRERALNAIRKLENALRLPRRVELPLLPGPTPVESDVEEQLCKTILARIEKQLAGIISYGRKKAKNAVAPAPQECEDRRVVDAQIYYGAKTKSPTVMFRAALAIRSISVEFSKFQQDKRGSSRVSQQVNCLSAKADQTQKAAMSEFIEKKNIFDHRIFERMIRSGTKMLVLEGLFGSCGISSLLWKVPSWSKLSYPELPIFLELFMQTPRYDKFRRVAEGLTRWYEKCQVIYDKSIKAQRNAFDTLSDGAAVGSMNPETPESSSGYIGPNATSDQLQNAEKSIDESMSIPNALEDDIVMFGEDICALTPRIERQGHQYSYPVVRSLPIEFSGSNRAELLSPQNYARAFNPPFQPADIDDPNYARAFDFPFEPVAIDSSFGGHGQPHFRSHRGSEELHDPIHARAFDFPFQPAVIGHRGSDELHDPNYARAFDFPFQPTAIDSTSGGYLRQTSNIQPSFLDHNSAGASDHLSFTATDSIPEAPCRQAGVSHFTGDPPEHRPPNGHSPRFGAGGIPATTEPAVHRSSVIDEHYHHIVDDIWCDQGVAQSFGADTIRLFGGPHLAQMVV